MELETVLGYLRVQDDSKAKAMKSAEEDAWQGGWQGQGPGQGQPWWKKKGPQQPQQQQQGQQGPGQAQTPK